MPFTMIVNPNAGKRAGVAVARQASEDLKKRGVDVVQQVSESAGHTVTLASEIDPGSTDGVIAVGGDGTLFEVLNGLYNRSGKIEIPVGQIPVGTGNSFLKDLEINTVEEAIEAIASGSVTQVDLGRLTRYAGFD